MDQAREFGDRVRRKRESLGLSQTAAARRAGLSPSGLRKIEKAQNKEGPERPSVIRISQLFGWDPDAELAHLGLALRTEGETTTAPRDPHDELTRCWPSLTPQQQWALAHLAEVMVAPRKWPAEPDHNPTSHPPADMTGVRVARFPINVLGGGDETDAGEPENGTAGIGHGD